ncbi:acyl-CoA dehydrogenase domain-containing protein [Paraphaeosphaeria sporulosa]|uniref:Acyl-CoA dehydrogenase domain-containing protein n=1 Tax=Paraphaeosphaeria sporulosa TaxID=1460663 RepID=A0A177CT26_9PLEO|nr:acyl-CoA dehydrogenase domain-containing protein [Paraphaeosphaeria sporulosa]OAG10446.1 acyl-CoA dehydrogenase domain-containing protein [Paraphaeosphaeria sporulosa]
MPIDFHLSPTESGVRAAAQTFARDVLIPSRRAPSSSAVSQQDRFAGTRALYEAAVTLGLIKAQIAAPLGGTGGSLVEAALLVEECYAADPSGASLTVFGTALGLMPLQLAPHAEKYVGFLEPFLMAGEGDAPLASLVFSEPGGTANWLEKGAPGLQTTVRKEGEEWVVSGEKVWGTNCAGWDGRGAELQVVVCRDVTTAAREGEDPKERIVIVLVTRADIVRNDDAAFQVVQHLETMGHKSYSGAHVRFTHLRVPQANILCGPGPQAVRTVLSSFDNTGVLVGAMAVGVMRAAFDAALAFAKADSRRGATPLLERQAVADKLGDIKMNAEACRALTWKAGHALGNGPGEYQERRELALATKVFCSEAAVKAVMDAISVVGVTAYDTAQPFAELLNTAIALPIFDGGNVAMRRRHMQDIMLSPNYDPWGATFGQS